MAKIKLAASDLDGTLLTSSKEITKRLYAALEKINSMGIYFVNSTGRVYNSLPKSVKELPFLKYVITSNGASVYDAEKKRDIIKNFLPPSAVDKTFEMIKNLDVVTEIFMNGKAYIDKAVFENLEGYGITGWSAEYVLSTRTPVESVYKKAMAEKDSLENINIIFNNPSLRIETWENLRKMNFASVTSSSPNNIEVTSLSATKANALKSLCSLLGIERENVVAFGDSDNDLDMILFAGTGVAMANGQEHIKQAADIITKDCDNFGVAEILEKITEKGEI